MTWRRTILTVSVLAALLIVAATASAHTREGTWVIQGAASVSSASGDLYGNENATQLSMSPGVHYFIIDKLAIGAEAPVQSFHQGDVTRTSMYIGPSAAYYFGDLDANVHPYLGAGVFVQSYSNKEALGNGLSISDNRTGTSVSFKGGVALFLREYLAISPELAVNLESLDGVSGTSINFGLSLAGFLY